MSDFFGPFGVGFWLTMAGFAGCFSLLAISFRARTPLRAARLVALASIGVWGLQSVSLFMGIALDVSRAPERAERFSWPYAFEDVRDVPINVLLLWSSGVLLGCFASRLLTLWKPSRAMQHLTELTSGEHDETTHEDKVRP